MIGFAGPPGDLGSPGNLRPSDYFSRYYRPAHQLARSTERIMALSLRLFERWASAQGFDGRVAALERDLVHAWLDALAAQGLAAKTIAQKRGDLLAVWNWAFDEGHAAGVPRRVRKIKLPRRMPAAWSLAELRAILSAAERLPGDCPWGPRRGDVIAALVRLCYDTCGRIGAVMAARRCDLAGDRLLLRAETQKQHADQRPRLSAATLAALNKIATCSEQLVEWPLDRGSDGFPTLNRWLGEALRMAGLPDSRRDKWQKLRRTSYTLCWLAGGPQAAQRAAGHSTLGLARNYLDATKLADPDPADLLPPL